MVGVGHNGEDSILARVSLVNQFGKCIYDKFVKPTERVTDYRTAVSGIRPADIKDGEAKRSGCRPAQMCTFFITVCVTAGEDVRTVQKEVADILKGRIVVGHAIHNDLKVASKYWRKLHLKKRNNALLCWFSNYELPSQILLLDHPKKKIRDTQKYKPFKKAVKVCHVTTISTRQISFGSSFKKSFVSPVWTALAESSL